VYTRSAPSTHTPGLFPSTIGAGILTGAAGSTVATCAEIVADAQRKSEKQMAADCTAPIGVQ
jgi:hypothetical protein